MAIIKNDKTGTWEVRTYYKDITGATKQKCWSRAELAIQSQLEITNPSQKRIANVPSSFFLFC